MWAVAFLRFIPTYAHLHSLNIFKSFTRNSTNCVATSQICNYFLNPAEPLPQNLRHSSCVLNYAKRIISILTMELTAVYLMREYLASFSQRACYATARIIHSCRFIFTDQPATHSTLCQDLFIYPPALKRAIISRSVNWGPTAKP